MGSADASRDADCRQTPSPFTPRGAQARFAFRSLGCNPGMGVGAKAHSRVATQATGPIGEGFRQAQPERKLVSATRRFDTSARTVGSGFSRRGPPPVQQRCGWAGHDAGRRRSALRSLHSNGRGEWEDEALQGTDATDSRSGLELQPRATHVLPGRHEGRKGVGSADSKRPWTRRQTPPPFAPPPTLLAMKVDHKLLT